MKQKTGSIMHSSWGSAMRMRGETPISPTSAPAHSHSNDTPPLPQRSGCLIWPRFRMRQAVNRGQSWFASDASWFANHD